METNYSSELQGDAAAEDVNDNLISMALRDRDQESFSVTLRHGKLEFRFKSGSSGEVASIVSNESYNDGFFHTVVLIRGGRKVDIFVDDISIGTVRLAKTASAGSGPSDVTLVSLGGVRPDLSAGDLLGTQQAFHGCIADAMFNNELLQLDRPLRFREAAIGRCENIPAPRAIEERMQANEIALSRCREVPQYTIEGRAVKFGDAPNSHVIISVNRKELQSVFNLTLDFRTYYPNGLLLHSSLKKKKLSNLLMVALKNGRVVVSLHGRRKQDVTSSGTLNDGKWHKIHIVKDKRKISLYVDDMPPTRSKAPNAIQLDGQLFIGGLSESTPSIVENAVVEGFKGCIRNLNINGRIQDLASGKNVVQKVGQCFAHVERGSYFPGDAYAVYSEDFRVGAMADIELEFRTTEMNGILLSVSERRGSPALSLSIEEGMVIMAVDMGDNHTFSVRQSFTTPFHVCDNKWHSVKASYVENALTLKVDNMDQQYGFSSNGEVRETKTKSPLYIGGLPDGAPQGTLHIRDNFKGCIRNLVIRGDFRDWTDMARLNNVLLNACPLQ